MVKSNGGVIGVRNSANGSSGTNLATGMWGLPEHGLYVKEGSWPKNTQQRVGSLQYLRGLWAFSL